MLPIPPGSAHFHPDVIYKIEGLAHVIPFTLLRHTKGVNFHAVPFLEGMNGLDRVIHEQDAFSPGKVDEVERPWYMHPQQDDNLITLVGTRVVELYSVEHKKIETFEISPEKITHNGVVVCDGPGILGWPPFVFHRNHSPYVGGSTSMNLAIRFKNFNIKSEFNIYDIMDIETGKYRMIRRGSVDQPFGKV
ncbi:MAG: hypothetical protein WCJ84_05360 [Candidatus Peregrinibacteria bacterium]